MEIRYGDIVEDSDRYRGDLPIFRDQCTEAITFHENSWRKPECSGVEANSLRQPLSFCGGALTLLPAPGGKASVLHTDMTWFDSEWEYQIQKKGTRRRGVKKVSFPYRLTLYFNIKNSLSQEFFLGINTV